MISTLWQGLRSLLFHSLLWLATACLLPLLLIGLVIRQPARNRFLSVYARYVVWLLKVVTGLDFQVTGREHIPAVSSVILSKHQSIWETFALQAVFPPQTWVLKKELLMIPVFGWALQAAASIAIDRKAGTRSLREVIEKGTDRLQRGLWVVVFPEGTRTRPGQQGKYNAGGVMLAVRAGAPVVPVAHNAGVYWPGSRFLIRPGTVQMVVGEPLATEGVKAGELNKQVEAWIEAQMDTLPGCAKPTEA